MTADARELKLPVWVQNELHDARVKAALRFPDKNPTPDFVFDSNGHSDAARPPEGTVLHCLRSIYGVYTLDIYVLRGSYLYPPDTEPNPRRMMDGGRRPTGEYWIDHNDAINAARYRVAMEAAQQLLKLEGKVQ